MIVLTVIIVFLLVQSGNPRPRRESKPRWTFSLSRGPNGIKWIAVKQQDPLKSGVNKSRQLKLQSAAKSKEPPEDEDLKKTPSPRETEVQP